MTTYNTSEFLSTYNTSSEFQKSNTFPTRYSRVLPSRLQTRYSRVFPSPQHDIPTSAFLPAPSPQHDIPTSLPTRRVPVVVDPNGTFFQVPCGTLGLWFKTWEFGNLVKS